MANNLMSNPVTYLYKYLKKYEAMIDTFKQVHTKRETLKKTTSTVKEIQKDVSSMEAEKENITSKLSNVKRKVCKRRKNLLALYVHPINFKL